MKTFTSIAMAVCVFASVAFTTTDSGEGVSRSSEVASSSRLAGCFQRFITHRQGNGAALMWTVSKAADIAGFEIERSYDGEYFDIIGDQPCNNVSTTRYNDTEVFPGFVYYRIKAYGNDGSVEYSTVSVVHIVKRK